MHSFKKIIYIISNVIFKNRYYFLRFVICAIHFTCKLYGVIFNCDISREKQDQTYVGPVYLDFYLQYNLKNTIDYFD